MAVFNFGDLANRRPAWIGAPWPRHRDARPVVRPAYHPAVKPVEFTPSDRGSRVLVVDDNPANRMLASELLALWGIKALLAVDGSEAVALACEHPLELILMDLRMPVLDGLGATRQIRRFELERARPRVPIVACTSAAFGDDRMRLQDFGLDGVLAKPCKAHELHQCLRRWCPQTTAAAFADTRDGARDHVSARR